MAPTNFWSTIKHGFVDICWSKVQGPSNSPSEGLYPVGPSTPQSVTTLVCLDAIESRRLFCQISTSDRVCEQLVPSMLCKISVKYIHTAVVNRSRARSHCRHMQSIDGSVQHLSW